MELDKAAERFFSVFSGLDRAYGIYNTARKSVPEGEKNVGSAKTIRDAPTVDLWKDHLLGNQGLGIVPIMDDQTVLFGAIDIDVYDGLSHKGISNQIADMNLPLIVCRTKSGGAHVYLFAREPIPASVVRTKLMEWSILLGFSGVEVFPKQTRLAGGGDVGNWINMPYFGAFKDAKLKGDRYAVLGGKSLSVEQFFDLVADIAVTNESIAEAGPPKDEESNGGLLYEGPPCLQTLERRGGIAKGGRNNGLFNLGVYLRKRYGEGDWEHRLDKYNQELISPPLGHKEVASIVKSVNRKAYEYKCQDQPICDLCNRQICLSRRFGISTSDSDPGVVFGQLIKIETDPVTWIWDVDGARIQLSTPELKDQGRFHTRAIEELNKWPNKVKPGEWAQVVRVALETCEIMEVPDDARPEGQMWFYLEQYCTQQARARNRDELVQKKPWTNEGRVYFHGSHFHQFLRKQGLNTPVRTLWVWLKNRGAEKHFFNIKGRGINVWSVEAFDEQTEAANVPTIRNRDEL